MMRAGSCSGARSHADPKNLQCAVHRLAMLLSIGLRLTEVPSPAEKPICA
jgi:hypothetical protein